MKLNETQLDFLFRACEFHWAVLQFSMSDKDFQEEYGYTKNEAHIAILDLKRQLRKKL